MDLSLTREKAFWSGRYERSVQDLIAALPVSEIAWDIGAHIGFFSLLLARRASVVALEPHPENAARLRRNVHLNHASVDVIEAAVGDALGTAEFEIGPESGTHRLATVDGVQWLAPSRGTQRVRVTTLDALLAHGVPSFVKIDIEGGETAALLAAPEMLALGPTLLCELHGKAAHEQVPAILDDYGYVVKRLDGDRILATR